MFLFIPLFYLIVGRLSNSGLVGMILQYRRLSQQPAIFLKMTGLRLNEFDELLHDLLPALGHAQAVSLTRPQRQRASGGRRSSELGGRDQLLLTVIWLRQYPTQAVLGYLFEVS
jgi:hypothetical protein